MRKYFTALLLVFFYSTAHTQTHQDSLDWISITSRWYDLDFTQPERDSMLDNMREMYELYQAMHRQYVYDTVPYPFGFRPLPNGLSVPVKQEPVKWNIPNDVVLPADSNALAFYSIPQLASLIRHKKISSVNLTRFFLNRLKKWGDTLECVISLTEDIAMEQARKADADLAKGIYRSPLQGIPYGLKDLFAVKGTKTTWGSTPYKDQVIEEDAFVYQQLRKAGAVLLGKLSLGALAYDNRWFGGFTRNPWNLQQGSSGSSAGSAAATAAGLVPFAIGTETLGSIVSPSNRCGATGLRPSFGSVSRSGAMVLCWSSDKIGPICRSAEDAAIVFYYIKGSDGRDASAVERAFNYNDRKDIKQLRIAYAANYFKRLPKEAAEWKVLDQYRALGVKLTPVDFPDSALYPNDIMGLILNAESSAAFDELTRSNRDDLIERQDKQFWPNIFRSGRFIPAVEYINANRLRYQLMESFYRFMQPYDVMIVPTFAGSQLSITNLTGNPVLVMPDGFSKQNTPLSITLIGRLYDEASILLAGKAYQDATEWNKKHPEKFRH